MWSDTAALCCICYYAVSLRLRVSTLWVQVELEARRWRAGVGVRSLTLCALSLSPSPSPSVFLRCMGGICPAASALAPKIGPLGMSPKKVGDDIKKGTMEFKGMNCTVKLTVLNRQATVSVVPSASTLLIKALAEGPREKGEGEPHDGNLTLDDVIEVAKVLRGKSMARDMAGTVKEILGTAFSIGCTVDGKAPRTVQNEITSGEQVIEDYEAPVVVAEE